MNQNAKTTQLTNQEKKKLVLNTLKTDFNLHSQHLNLLSTVMENVDYIDNALTLAEIAGFITEGSLLASTASTIGIVTLFFSPVAGIITLINANESGERTYGMRAVAYTMTAWAYNEAVLPGSNRILQNMRLGFPRVPPEKIKRYHEAWRKASQAMLAHLNSQTNSGKISKKSLQLLLQALGNNNKRQLCLEALKGFENQIPQTELKYWRANYRVLYPE